MNNIFIILFLLLLVFSCGQNHEKKKATPHQMQMSEGMHAGELHLSDQQIKLGNITIDSLREHFLGEELFITGIVGPNQNRVTSVSSRVMGRIEKLYFKNTGDIILKGEPLYEIYSEDLNLAIREFLLAKERRRSLKNEQADMKKIIQSEVNKLRLYGLSEDQINSLEGQKSFSGTLKILSPVAGVITSVDKKEGDYVMEGGSVFHLADYSTLWVEGQVYSDYLTDVKEGMMAKITFPGFSDKEVAGKISFINPELNPSSKINLIRIEIVNKNGELKPGMQASVNILTNKTKTLSLPTDAILIEDKGSTVWIKTGHNTFKSKMITTGLEANGFTEIKNGLNRGDVVVITGAYLLNSEFIFKRGTNPMEGHDMNKM